MKTTHSTEEIRHFLQTSKGADPSSIKSLQEGHSNQALYFENHTGDKLVLRIALGEDDFLHDKYAHEKLHGRLPVPKVWEIGMFGGDSFYCISEYIDGVPSDTIKQAEIDTMQPKILNAYAAIFTIDISGSSGYGPIDLKTDNGEFGSWHEKLACELKRFDAESVRSHATNIGLDLTLADKFIAQATANLPFASERRRLVHGDLGFDNMLICNGEVAAFIDWAKISYGDWMEDFANFDFWWPGRHGDKQAFAKQYGLDAEHLEEREALYWAITALETIRFADTFKKQEISQWLHDYVASKLSHRTRSAERKELAVARSLVETA
ncbi:MAG: hypothetical protein AUH91_01715 [Verrucomicrobia bacterium 13_1_40CM_4_54_4]|nr:MAG: hypothetical protein AUH91_01715 [Verrucomicrobia bacterium 13_1_40CM_4_54_4]